MANQIRFGVGFDVDKSGLNEIKKELAEIRSLTKNDLVNMGNSKSLRAAEADLANIKKSANDVEAALNSAFNTKLNTINIQAFNDSLAASGTNIQQIFTNFSKAGGQGYTAFNQMAAKIMFSNQEITKTNTLLNKMGDTFARTIRWTAASTVIRKITGSVQECIGYVKHLDESLNNIAIVTQKSADEMDRFAVAANKSAQKLGVTTTAFTDAALTFFQQGLSDKEVEVRTNLSLKVANASGLNADDAATYVTSVLNGFKIGADDAEKAMDILANVGAHTASSLSELSEAMAKSASAASALGVSEEQLAAMMATTIATTRQEASSVGNAYKTFLGRISAIKAGTDEAEISLGNYNSKMAELGFNVLDSSGQLRDMGEVIEEIGAKWSNLSREQQISLAQTMGGVRQYNNLIALFDNWDKYTETLGYASEAEGTLQRQNETYLESTQAHLAAMTAAKENVFDSILDAGTINAFADAMKNVLNFTASWIDAIGGGGNLLLGLGSIATKVFSGKIANGIISNINNFKMAKLSADNFRESLEKIKQEVEQAYSADGKKGAPYKGIFDETVKKYNDIVTGEGVFFTSEQKSKIGELMSAELEARGKLIQNEEIRTQASKYMGGFLSYDTNKRQANKLGEEVFKYGKNSLWQNRILADFKITAKEIETDTDNAARALKRLETASSDVNKIQLNNFKTNLTSIKGTAEKLSGVLGEKETRNLINNLDALERKRKELVEGSKDNQMSQEQQADLQNEIQNIIAKTGIAYEQVVEEVRNRIETLKQAIKLGLENVDEEELKKLENIEKAFSAYSETGKGQGRVKGFVSLAASIGQVTSAIMSLKNLGSIFSNKDLSIGEKLLQTIQSMAFSIPQLVSGLGGMKKGFEQLGVKSVSGLFKSIGSFFTSLPGMIAIGVAAVASFIAILVYASNSAERELKKAKETAEQLKKSYNDVKSAWEELRQSLENYDEAVKGLEELKKGTQEWADALKEANQQALDLITTTPALAQFMSKNDDGLIVFGGPGYEEFLDKMEKDVVDRQTAAFLASVRVNELELQRDREKLNGLLSKGAFKPTDVDLANRIYAGNDEIQLYREDSDKIDTIKFSDEDLDELVSIYKENGAIIASDIEEHFGGTPDVIEQYLPSINSLCEQIASREVSDFNLAKESASNSILNSAEYNTLPDFLREFLASNVAANFEISTEELNKAVSDFKKGTGTSFQDWKRNNTLTQVTYDSTDAEKQAYENYVYSLAYNQLLSDEIAKFYAENIKVFNNLGKEAENMSDEAVKAFGDIINGNANYADVMATLNQEDFEAVSNALGSLGGDFIQELIEGILNARGKVSFFDTFGDLAFDEEAYKENARKKANSAGESAAKSSGIDVDAFKAARIEVEKQNKILSDVEETWDEYYKRINDTTLAVLRFNKGSETLQKSQKDLQAILSATGNTYTSLAADFSGTFKEIYSDLFNMTEEGMKLLPEDFFMNKDNLKLLSKGTKEALAELQNAGQFANGKAATISVGVEFDSEGLEKTYDDLLNIVAKYDDAKFEVGVDIKDEGFRQACQNLINQAGLTVEQANAVFNKMGYTVKAVKVPYQDYEWRETIDKSGSYTDEDGRKISLHEYKKVQIPVTRYTTQLAYIAKTGGGVSVPSVGSSGGSGGKGSSSKSNSDVYHAVNNKLSNTSKSTSQLKANRQSLTGSSLADSYSKESDLLKEQIKYLKEKKAIAEQERDSNLANLKALAAANKINVDVDGNGVITNYNDIVLAFEALGESASDSYDKFMEHLKKYEDAKINIIPEMDEQVLQSSLDIISNNIEKAKVTLNLNIDLNEWTRNWNEFKREYIEGFKDDDILGKIYETTANAVTYMNEKGTGDVQKLTKAVKDDLNAYYKALVGKEGLFSTSASGQFIVDWSKAISTSKEDAEKALSSIRDYYDKIIDGSQKTFLESIDKVGEALKQQNDSLDFFEQQVQHDIKLVQLLYGEKAYKKMADFYKKDTEARKKQAENLVSGATYLYEQMNAARLSGNDEAYEALKEKWEDFLKEATSSLETWAETVANEYANTIEVMLQELINGMDLDVISNQLEMIRDNMDNYLDDINRAYGTDSLMRKWKDTIDGASSLPIQQKLTAAMQKQSTYLNEKDKLSQYDLERAEKEYNLLVAQIALEEAQLNKNTMRLRRDANGNYSYVYTADEAALSAAQKKYDDLKNELYNFDLSALDDNYGKGVEVVKSFAEKVKAIENDLSLSEDERAKRIQELTTWYEAETAAIKEQNLEIQKNLEMTDSLFSSATMEKDTYGLTTALNELVPTLNSDAQALINLFGEMNLEDFFNSIGVLLDDVHNVFAEIDKQNEILDSQVNSQNGPISADDAQRLEEAKYAMDKANEALQKLTAGFTEAVNIISAFNELMPMMSNGGGSSAEVQAILKKYGIAAFASGGYTGDWNGDGKLAVLHEKELVLNSDDTRNILDAVQLIGNIEKAAMLGQVISLAGVGSGFNSVDGGKLDSIEQNVHIDATFPGVRDASEIVDAMNSLVNVASQRLYRKY